MLTYLEFGCQHGVNNIFKGLTFLLFEGLQQPLDASCHVSYTPPLQYQ